MVLSNGKVAMDYGPTTDGEWLLFNCVVSMHLSMHADKWIRVGAIVFTCTLFLVYDNVY